MNKKILHVCYIDKFIPSFVKLVRSKVKTNTHSFVTMGRNFKKYPVEKGDDLTYYSGRYFRYFAIAKKMNTSDKIMLHGLFDPGVIMLLFLQPWLLKKCYWVMWGGDIYYTPKKSLLSSIIEFCKLHVAKKMGYLVTYIKGDIDHVRELYGAKGQYKYCIMYPSNCYKETVLGKKTNNIINIQVGNSADIENEHTYIFNKVKNSSIDNIKVFAPLSYGDKSYAETVSVLGHKYFGSNFIVMNKFMPLDDYTKWQASIDIAIFAHKRQQGMGNTISLLGLGKSVYMRSGVSSTLALEELGLKLGHIETEKIQLLPQINVESNVAIVKKEFSETALVEQLSGLFS